MGIFKNTVKLTKTCRRLNDAKHEFYKTSAHDYDLSRCKTHNIKVCFVTSNAVKQKLV